MNNSTNATTPRPFYTYVDMALLNRLHYSYYAITSFYILVGTPLCVWFMAAILTVPDMRRRLRNQLVCAICLSYTLKSTVSGSLEMFTVIATKELGGDITCYMHSVIFNLRVIFEFSGSWQTVILLIVYLAQICDYDPSSTLTPMILNMGKGLLIMLPFVLAIILVPSIGLVYLSNFGKRSPGCIVATLYGVIVLRSVDYMIPLIISIILLIVVAVLYYRRLHRGCFTLHMMQGGLMSQGRQVDNVMAYLVAIFVDVVCRLPATFSLFELDMDINQGLTYTYVSWMIIDARSVILPWGWLLLGDIRERIKTWRPWYRPAPGIDLTITYKKEEKADN